MFKSLAALAIPQSLYALTTNHLALAQTIRPFAQLQFFRSFFAIFSAPGGEKITPQDRDLVRRGLSFSKKIENQQDSAPVLAVDQLSKSCRSNLDLSVYLPRGNPKIRVFTSRISNRDRDRDFYKPRLRGVIVGSRSRSRLAIILVFFKNPGVDVRLAMRSILVKQQPWCSCN